MKYLIDGYNLMHARGLMDRKFAPSEFRKVRHRFLTDLAAALDTTEGHATTVVFDARTPPEHLPNRQKLKGLTIVFAVGDENADARIEALIGSHSSPKNLTVVSTDLQIRRAAERRKAKVMTSDEFLMKLLSKHRATKKIEIPEPSAALPKSPVLSQSESAFWQAEFADVDKEPGVREALRASDFVPTDEEIAKIEQEVKNER